MLKHFSYKCPAHDICNYEHWRVAIMNTYRLFDPSSINMAGYERILPYFGEASAEPKYKQEELISAIVIE